MKTWKVIDEGLMPENGRTMIPYSCPNCEVESLLPVVGLAMAQIGPRLVFDIGGHAVPKVVECRNCRRRMEAA